MDIKKVLVAVDASDNSARAVDYVGRMLGAGQDFSVTVLCLDRPSERDLFPDEAAWREHCAAQERNYAKFLERSRAELLAAGFSETAVKTRFACTLTTSIAQSILDVQRGEGFGTVVVGRRGVSKAEEFLFGSVSSRVVQHARNCTVWVVE